MFSKSQIIAILKIFCFYFDLRNNSNQNSRNLFVIALPRNLAFPMSLSEYYDLCMQKTLPLWLCRISQPGGKRLFWFSISCCLEGDWDKLTTDAVTRKVPIKVYKDAQKLSNKSCSELAWDLSDNFCIHVAKYWAQKRKKRRASILLPLCCSTLTHCMLWRNSSKIAG